MDFEDDFFDDYEDDSFGSPSGRHLPNDQNLAANNLDSLNLPDPVTSYLFLSDDVQDEFGNPLNRKLKCLLCGHEFLGRKSDHCPICYGTIFSEVM